MLKQRVVTAVILLVLFLSALFELPAFGWTVLVVVIVMQSTVEWANLAGLSGRPANIYWWTTFALMCGVTWFDATGVLAQHSVIHMLVYGASLLLWLVVVPFWLGMRWQVRDPVLLAVTGWIVLIPTGLAMMDLRDNSPWLLLGVMVLVWVADSAAYFAGRRFGRTKLAPNISPGKTWEGVIGALAGVSLYVIAVWAALPYSNLARFIPNILLASWCWVGLAILGDLFESAIKRQAGLKDSGALLPGHGGLLDRIDALTSTLPLAALALLIQRVP